MRLYDGSDEAVAWLVAVVKALGGGDDAIGAVDAVIDALVRRLEGGCRLLLLFSTARRRLSMLCFVKALGGGDDAKGSCFDCSEEETMRKGVASTARRRPVACFAPVALDAFLRRQGSRRRRRCERGLLRRLRGGLSMLCSCFRQLSEEAAAREEALGFARGLCCCCL
jgi:hypothetical protein